MPPLDESWQGGAEPIDTHPRCSFEAQAVAHATRSPLSPRTTDENQVSAGLFGRSLRVLRVGVGDDELKRRVWDRRLAALLAA